RVQGSKGPSLLELLDPRTLGPFGSSAPSVLVTMMQVRPMRMRMRDRVVRVRMGVARGGGDPRMRVQVMGVVVAVTVDVLDGGMVVRVGVGRAEHRAGRRGAK